MVKREKSPEIEEDVRLYVAWMPYPLNANLEIKNDRKACVEWVIEIIGNEHLMNIYQKPSSRGMFLLEISKSYDKENKCLLGEHKWSQFLKDPTEEEKSSKTCVFYSIYPTCREAGKDGWRTVKLSPKWFQNWKVGEGRFVHPFPEPSYCPPPSEDRTGKSICRNLPVELRPLQVEASRSPPPIVGSTDWGKRNGGERSGTSESPIKTTRQNMRPPINLTSPTSPIISRSATEKSQRSPTISRSPSLGPASGPPSPLVKLPRGKPIPLRQFQSQGQPSNAKKGTWTSHVQPSSSTAGKSPISEQVSTKPMNAWAKPLQIVPEKPAKVTTAVSVDDWAEPSSASWFDIVEEEGTFDAPNARSPSPGSSKNETNAKDIYADLNSSDDDEGVTVKLMATSLGKTEPAGPDKDRFNAPPSVDTDDSDDEITKDKIICPSHGEICPKKICRDYKKLEYQQKQKEIKEARKKKQEEREAKREKRRRRNNEGDSGVPESQADSNSSSSD